MLKGSCDVTRRNMETPMPTASQQEAGDRRKSVLSRGFLTVCPLSKSSRPRAAQPNGQKGRGWEFKSTEDRQGAVWPGHIGLTCPCSLSWGIPTVYK